MTLFAMQYTASAPMTSFLKRSWIQWAVVISLALHIGTALVIIYLGGFSTIGTHSPNLVIQDIDLSPSFYAPAKPLATPREQRQVMKPSPPLPVQKAEVPNQESPHEIQQPATMNNMKDGGITSTPLGLGMTHGYFTPLADGKTLRDDVRAYYFEIVEKINREWWEKAALLKDPLREDGVFEIAIQRDGTVEEQRLLRGTGSSEADRLIADIIRRSSPLPPLPTTYEPNQFRAPLRIKAPLSLFRFKN